MTGKRFSHLASSLLAALLLTACGGGSSGGGLTSNIDNSGGGTGGGTGSGSGSDDGNTWTAGVYAPQKDVKNLCEVPRDGVFVDLNGEEYVDSQGSIIDEKLWLRSWSNDTYLWYDELDDIDPNNCGEQGDNCSVLEYFDELRTNALTPSGVPKDNFHFTQDTEEYNRQTEGGVTYSYGIEWKIARGGAPNREIFIAYIQDGTPAADTDLMRGARIIEADGVDAVNGGTPADVNVLIAAMFPESIGESHEFVFELRDGSEKTYTLTSASFNTQAVSLTRTLDTPAGKVGYMQFNTHIVTAQEQLISAVETFAQNNITELVLDLRYNGGGRLAIASQLGYMLVGDYSTQDGFYFERLEFNDKYPNSDPVTDQEIEPLLFIDQEIDYEQGIVKGQLPTLNLTQVTVLTDSSTCSASEALMNALRGIDVDVVQIGGKTCGKPYGFYPTDNCGTTYFTIQFKGVNANDFGEYASGFYPSESPSLPTEVEGCSVADDLSQDLGNPEEGMLSAALHYLETGSCPMVAQQQHAPASLQKHIEAIPGSELNVPSPWQRAVMLEAGQSRQPIREP